MITIQSQGICGPTNITPNSTDDCIKYTTDTSWCCLLNATNVPALYTVCNYIHKDYPTPLITVGNMNYRMDCHGIDNFKQNFPFEDEYIPCGVQHPSTESDCSKYNKEENTCCMASTDNTFNNTNINYCYFYKSSKGSFNTLNSENVNLYFKCNSIGLTYQSYIVFLLILFII